MPTRILFVCHGNICRSPMAEFVLRDLAMRNGAANLVRVDSAAATAEEIGNPVHPGTRRVLAEHNVACIGHVARQVSRDEYGRWDLIVVMDDENVRDLARIFKKDPQHKVHKLMEFAPGNTVGAQVRDVADPWYTGNFDATWDDVLAGCQGLLDWLRAR